MRLDAEALMRLLPALHRIRDAEQGSLADLLGVLAEQAAVLQEDLAQLYDDQFIETCSEWVVPYIGDLVGARGPFLPPELGLSQRALVANTLAYRRRKGTAALLEQLARDATGWDANVVEFFQRLATTQYLNHLRPANRSFAGLRDKAALDRIGTPFDDVARTADMRRIETGRGKHNIPNIGIFLWRIGNHALTRAPAYKVDDRRYRFDAIGRDLPLYNRPITETQITHLAEPLNVPMMLDRHLLDRALDVYYGPNASVLLTVNGVDLAAGGSPPAALSDRLCVCDLRDVTDATGAVLRWAHMPVKRIAIDPVLGRIAFPTSEPPPSDVRVSFQYGAASEIGGGEYGRDRTFAADLQPVIRVPEDVPTVAQALAQLAPSGGVVQISRNDYVLETLVLRVPSGKTIELRAADERRPIVLPVGGKLTVLGGEESAASLNGLLVAGTIDVPANDGAHRNSLRTLRLKHCTLVPGAVPQIVSPQGVAPALADGPRLILRPTTSTAEIERCILGGIRAPDGAHLRIRDSIVDAGADDRVAHAALDGISAGAALDIEHSTVIGKVHAAIMQASGVIFLARTARADGWAGPVLAARLQEGCVRFSYVPPGSRVPRPYRCQPTEPTAAARMRPVFTSLRCGDPGYGQLSRQSAIEIREGNEDGAEVGVFHHLFQAQREAILRERLDEYLRFGLEAGVFFAS